MSDWNRPVFDVADSTVGVFDGEAAGRVRRGRASAVDVTPRCTRTTGAVASAPPSRAGSEPARSKGVAEIGMPVPVGSAGDRLLYRAGLSRALEQLGARAARGRDRAGATAARRVSSPARPRPSEYEQCWSGSRRTPSSSGPQRERQPFHDWLAEVTGRPGFEPWNLRVVADPSGAVVSMAWVQLGEESAFVARLATRRDQRGRGIAQALLVDAFAVAREHGASRSELITASERPSTSDLAYRAARKRHPAGLNLPVFQ